MFPMSPLESWTFLILVFTIVFAGPTAVKNVFNYVCERARQRQLEEYYSSKQ
jgi:hypothetical protein